VNRLTIDDASLDVLVGFNVDTSLEDARATAQTIAFPPGSNHRSSENPTSAPTMIRRTTSIGNSR
jgi:hypothetical protein